MIAEIVDRDPNLRAGQNLYLPVLIRGKRHAGRLLILTHSILAASREVDEMSQGGLNQPSQPLLVLEVVDQAATIQAAVSYLQSQGTCLKLKAQQEDLFQNPATVDSTKMIAHPKTLVTVV